MSFDKEIAQIIKDALKEDIGKGDITSSLCGLRNKKIRAAVIFKEKGVVCGLKVIETVFKSADRTLIFRPAFREGKVIQAGRIAAYVEGNAGGILAAERTALNFLGRLSGIATQTRRFTDRIKPCKAKITDTRKTTPNMRWLEKYAVKCGGGHNHRMGLYDRVLIKDNHIEIASLEEMPLRRSNTIKQLVTMAKSHAPKGIKIEVEVENLREFMAAIELRPDIIMLDNMPVRDMTKAVKIRNAITRRRTPLLEASGGITLDNARRIAGTGVDIISIGSLTHSVRSLDVSLEII